MTEFFDLLRGMGFYAGGAASAVEILFRVTVLLLTAGAIAFCLRRSSAALKHLVWTLSVVGTLLIPLFYWAFPAWRWAVLPAPPVSLASGANDALIGAALPYTNHVASPTRDLPGEFSIAHTGQPAENATRAKIGGPAGQKTVFHGDLPSRPALSWPGIMAAVWGAGTFCFLAWTLTGIIGAWSVARRSEPGGGANWQYILHNLRDKCGISRGVEIRQCAQLSVPMTWGFLRPVILIPADSTLWPEDVKRSVLLHELGHIRRHDCLIHFLSRLALAGYWFHPLVWIAARQLRKTSEQAADDAVLSSQIAPPDYAEHLLRIAAGMRGMKWFAHAVLPMAGSSDLAGRVVAILDSNRNHRSITKITYFSLLTLTLMLLIPCAILRLGYAQDKTNPTTPANTSETFQILSGEVKNIDGKPIKGAIVAFNFGGMTLFHEAKTDAEGRFEIRNKSMSPTWVTVEADGYASKRQKLSAEIKGKSFFISLVLESAQTIRGRVVDTQGKPLAGVNVNTNATDFNNIPFFQTTTDRNGRFVWKYAPGNTIPIGLWAEGMMMKDQDLQASDKEHTITLDPQMHILGTIVDEETGKPINKFRFYIGGHKRNNDEITYELWDQGRKDNIFVIGNNQPFNEKDYIKIEADGYETITKEFQHSPGEQRLEIKMKRVNKPSAASQDNSEPAKQIKTIGGKVVDDAVKDASGSEKEKSSKKPAFTVHAVDAQSGEPIVKVPLEVVAQYLNKDKPETTKYSTDVNGDARVELNNGPFGNIFFYARAVGYVPQALCWNLRDHPLSLPGEINLKFEKGISIGGTVQDDSDKPVSGATVEIYAPALVDGTEGVSTVEKPRTDREGKWRCDVVPKNITRCSIVVQHPDYLNAQSVVTEDMKQFKHVLRLGRGGNVTGQVLDQKDKPVEGARISYPLYAGDMLEPKAKTDAEGRFELKKCRLGPTSIFVSAKGFAPQYQAIDIGKETKPLEFRLEPGNTIRGRVVDLHGNPIAKTKVYAESWHKFRVFDSVVADQDGRFVWNSAPSDEVVLDFNPPGNWTRINQPLTASEQEQTITLYPELDIRGTVTDEASGKPIDQFQIIVSIDWERDGGMIKDKRIPGQKGLYEYKSKFSYPATYIGIEAEGYKPALSRKFLPIEGKQQYDFKLKKIK